MTSGPQVIAVHPAVAAKSVQDLIALAKAKPGQLNYASGGAGTANHIAVEYFKLAAGIDVLHVPYKVKYARDQRGRHQAGVGVRKVR